MRNFAILHTRYWQWARDNDLSVLETCLGAYILTNEHSNSLGCYRLPLTYIAEDLGQPADSVWETLSTLCEQGLLTYCTTSKHVFIKKYLKWNPPQNKDHARGTLKIIENLPSKFSLLPEVLEAFTAYAGKYLSNSDIKERVDTLWTACGHGGGQPVNTVSTPFTSPSQQGGDTLCASLGTPSAHTETETERETDTDCPEPESASGLSDSSSSSSLSYSLPTLLEIPLIKKDGVLKVTQTDIDEWEDTYPGVDVWAELKKIRQWNIDNPKKRKTKNGIRRHITSWLDKEQNKPKSTPKPRKSERKLVL